MNIIYPSMKHNGKSSCVHLKEDGLSVIQLSTHIFKVYVTTWSHCWVSVVAQIVKNLPGMWETQVQSLGRKDSRRREWQPAPVFSPERSHGQRSWWTTVHGVRRVGPDLSASTLTFQSHYY